MGTHDKRSRTQRAAASARNLRYISRGHYDEKVREGLAEYEDRRAMA